MSSIHLLVECKSSVHFSTRCLLLIDSELTFPAEGKHEEAKVLKLGRFWPVEQRSSLHS